MNKVYYVYILTNDKNGTLYIGVTNDLRRRLHEHKNNLVKGFTEKYSIHKLVWYECTNSIDSAIQREKQLKKWNRRWKIRLIEETNPIWKDLSSNDL
ncbi:MAG: GIY-YIG nuclease family protein [Candidatus Paceibacterota bacterium]